MSHTFLDFNLWPLYDVTFAHDFGVIMKRNHTSLMRLYNNVERFPTCINGYDL